MLLWSRTSDHNTLEMNVLRCRKFCNILKIVHQSSSDQGNFLASVNGKTNGNTSKWELIFIIRYLFFSFPHDVANTRTVALVKHALTSSQKSTFQWSFHEESSRGSPYLSLQFNSQLPFFLVIFVVDFAYSSSSAIIETTIIRTICVWFDSC